LLAVVNACNLDRGAVEVHSRHRSTISRNERRNGHHFEFRSWFFVLDRFPMLEPVDVGQPLTVMSEYLDRRGVPDAG
jgi:hypothetical protein